MLPSSSPCVETVYLKNIVTVGIFKNKKNKNEKKDKVKVFRFRSISYVFSPPARSILVLSGGIVPFHLGSSCKVLKNGLEVIYWEN